VEALFDLLQHHGDAATREAIAKCGDAKRFGAEYIRHTLDPSSGPAPIAWTWKKGEGDSGNGAGPLPRRGQRFRKASRFGGAASKRGAR